MRSNAPLSSVGNLRACSKSYVTNSLKTLNRVSYSSNVNFGLAVYSPDLWKLTINVEYDFQGTELRTKRFLS